MAITLKERPIFILGYPRSGTTLVMALLGSHSRISIPEVGWFFPHFFPFLHTYGDLNNPDNLYTLADEMLFSPKKFLWGMDLNPRTAVDELLSGIREKSFAGLYCALHEMYARKNGDKPRWGQKTPGNTFFIGQIRECFPNAQFIFINRDGRDSCADYLKSSFGPTNVFAAAEFWKLLQNAAKPWREKLSSQDWMDIRYEELVNKPTEVLSDICKFLGEKFEPAMLDFWKGDIAQGRARQPDHKPLGHPISNKYIGIYKRYLSQHDQEIFAGVAGKELVEAGYSMDVEPAIITPEEEERMREWDGRFRTSLLDSKWGHIREESYLDWLEDQREERKKKGIWKDSDAPDFPYAGHPLEEIVVGKRGFNKWKHYFCIKRQYTQKNEIF